VVLPALAALVLAACPPGAATRAGAPASAQQLVTFVAPSRRSTIAALSLWARRADGCWTRAAGPWRARVGRNGVSANRREGDGTTPIGVFAFGRTMYGLAPDPGVRFAYHRLVCGDWWDGDARSPTYNRFRHVRCGARPPFRAGEALWTYATAYRYLAVIGFNSAPRVPHRGSAIFLHASTGRATAGCISLPLPQLVSILRRLDPAAKPVISIRVA
jgi:L,D-peptidoglycan transpeptidase YkuD (ErfK/YbiS/YcfS/YnhG family)